MPRILLSFGRVAAFLAAGQVYALAQGTQTASLVGQVVDSAELPMAGVEVRLSSPSLQGVRVVVTDAGGRFAARLLPPGLYRITLSKAGFTTVTRDERLSLEQNLSTRFVLSKEATAVVEVVASVNQQDKAEFKTSTNFTKEAIDALPVDRNPLNVALLAPGVVENVNQDRGGMQIRGSQGTGNLWLLDGQNYADNVYNGPRAKFVTDAIEETQVITGAIPAEFGDVEGGVVNTITKSGGDEFTAQLRWDLSSDRWKAARHGENGAAFSDKINQERMAQLGGPLVKSKLWFYTSYFSLARNNAQSLPTDQAALGAPFGQPYTENIKDIRRQLKLTWAITDRHTLVGTHHSYSENFGNIDYVGSGDGHFSTRRFTQNIYGLQLRSLLTDVLTMSLKVGKKDQTIAVGSNNVALPIYNNDDGYFYQAGYFDPRDPGDIRNNQTANLKFSYFMGSADSSQQIDVGWDYYRGTTKASGAQTPVDLLIGGKPWNSYANASGLDLTNGTVNTDGASTFSYLTQPGEAGTEQHALYLNDKWSVNKHWSANLGLRFDKYTAEDRALKRTTAANHALSPRLGVNYDVLGDSAWVLGAAYSRYNGKPLEIQLSVATYVNNPIAATFAYNGPAGQQPFAALANPANYNPVPQSYTDAAINIKVDPNLKAQTVDEVQLSATHNFRHPTLGEGYLKATYVSKTWNNLIDLRSGNDGTVPNPAGGSPLFVTFWHNEPNAKRDYHSLELDGALSKGRYTVNGNLVLSRLKGNYEGEVKGAPGSGAGYDWFTVQNGVRMYDPAVTNPYGYLLGHVPVRSRINAISRWSNPLGELTVGLLFSYDGPQTYSHLRVITDASSLNPAIDPQAAGLRLFQYRSNTRGDGEYHAQRYLDFSLQQDFRLKKFANGRKVDAYLKVVVENAFNHQQQVTYGTGYGALAAGNPIATPFVANAGFGVAGPTNYGRARRMYLSTGLKF